MKLTHLYATDFFSYKLLDIDLNKFPVVQVYGVNKQTGESIGVGKTSIFLIISEILYSKNPSSIKKALINNINTKNKFSAMLDFESEKSSYTLKYSPLVTELYKDDKLFITGRKNVTEYIETTFIPYSLFINFSYLSNTFRGVLFTGTDSEKKQLLQLCFKDLLRFTKYKDRVKAELNRVKQEIATFTALLANTTDLAIPEEKPITQLPELDLTYYSKLKADITNLEVEIRANEQKLDSVKILELEKPEFDISYYNQLNLKIQQLQKEQTNAKKLSAYTHCPTCGAKITITKDYITEKLNQLNKLQQEYATLTAEYTKYKKALSQYNLNEANKKVKNSIPDQTANKVKLQQLRREYEVLSADYETYKQVSQENQVAIKSNQIRAKLLKQQEEINRKRAYQQQELAVYKSRLPILKALADAFSSNGILSAKLPQRLDSLSTIINSYLKQFNSLLSIEMTINKDKIDIAIHRGNTHFTFNNCSGGERSLISISLALGFRQLFPHLATNILFLDEVVSSLDKSIRLKLINILAAENLNSYIISHDSLDSNIPMLYITKDNEVSKAEWVLENYE